MFKMILLLGLFLPMPLFSAEENSGISLEEFALKLVLSDIQVNYCVKAYEQAEKGQLDSEQLWKQLWAERGVTKNIPRLKTPLTRYKNYFIYEYQVGHRRITDIRQCNALPNIKEPLNIPLEHTCSAHDNQIDEIRNLSEPIIKYVYVNLEDELKEGEELASTYCHGEYMIKDPHNPMKCLRACDDGFLKIDYYILSNSPEDSDKSLLEKYGPPLGDDEYICLPCEEKGLVWEPIEKRCMTSDNCDENEEYVEEVNECKMKCRNYEHRLAEKEYQCTLKPNVGCEFCSYLTRRVENWQPNMNHLTHEWIAETSEIVGCEASEILSEAKRYKSHLLNLLHQGKSTCSKMTNLYGQGCSHIFSSNEFGNYLFVHSNSSCHSSSFFNGYINLPDLYDLIINFSEQYNK